MEPASFAASILTLIAAAGATTEFVYNFILDIENIPEEIHSQAIKLQCLHQTFSTLMDTYTNDALHAEVQLDPYLQSHLKLFVVAIHDLEKKLRRSSTSLSGGRKQHLWARMKWLSTDRELRKFYDKLDDWMRIFLTAIHTTEMFKITVSLFLETWLMTNSKLLTRIVDETSRTHQVPTIAAHEFQQVSAMRAHPNVTNAPSGLLQHLSATVSTVPSNTTIPPALRALLAQKADCVGHRVHRWYAFRTKVWLLDVRTGPAVVRTWTDEGKSVYKAVAWQKGMYLSSTFRTQLMSSKRMTFVLSYLLDGSKLSFNFNLMLRGLLQAKSPAYAACQKGDWLQLRRLLQDKHVGISDTTGYGDTLLHVRIHVRLRTSLKLTLHQIAARHNHTDLVAALLQSGAKVDVQNDFGE
jgi:hypothetical protein